METCSNEYLHGMTEGGQRAFRTESCYGENNTWIWNWSQIVWFVQKMWLEITQMLMVNKQQNYFHVYVSGKKDDRSDRGVLLIYKNGFKATAVNMNYIPK